MYHVRLLHIARSRPLPHRLPLPPPRPPSRRFTVLALESSADDTCAAVVTEDREILSNIVVNQQASLEQYGGIHPYVALHAHQRNMPVVVQRALRDAGLTVNEIDGVAFTRGPGIAGCLSVCGNAARTLAAALSKPLVGVHHMQAHALTPFLTSPPDQLPQYPFLTLLVSGGHTLLLLATSPTSFRILAATLDEAVGNAYDKVAKLLRIPYEGKAAGAAIERLCASEGEGAEIPMPRPIRGRLAFSYTGLHSAVERFLHARKGEVDERTKVGIARSFQKAAVGQLEDKLVLGMRQCAKEGLRVRCLVVSGGVASNQYLRDRLRACLDRESPDKHVSLAFPPPSLCTDNAAMIAWASMHRFLAGETDEYSLESRPVWSLEDLEREEAGPSRS
ncbi:peptidase M22 glycoprotease [Dichomitus squalens]|uniref:N(6)-L-threonylcarbamoyladenine synthase n=1 Tax=Dichomitus squalens TaxID=114155 RepID=A0A4Q9NDL1_9APHY|nr:peptidase M22 glycoprotease [Dichomitus squalens]TBU55028.1 peptidase M22 glycoprotease [Dichomitus squalens]